MEFLIVPMILGLIPAAIAHSRGLPFVTWWLYGALLWPVALVHVFFARPGSVTISQGVGGGRVCPHCAEAIKPEANVCKHCGRDLAPTATRESTPHDKPRPTSAMYRPYDPNKK
jgi:hypothetical protein